MNKESPVSVLSFRNSQSYKGFREEWNRIQSGEPDEVAEANRWVKEHSEEWKELEHMLYYSEAKQRRLVSFDTLEDAERKQTGPCDREEFLPEASRNRIYQDKMWFDRSAYLPEESDEEPRMYLNTQIVDGLHKLTELQREVLFRTVINGESTESVAQDMNCTSRNIRDIRGRALRQLRRGITRHEASGYLDAFVLALLVAMFACRGMMAIADYLLPIYPWLENVAGAIAALFLGFVLFRSRNDEVEDLLRRHWDSLNGPRGKE